MARFKGERREAADPRGSSYQIHAWGLHTCSTDILETLSTLPIGGAIGRVFLPVKVAVCSRACPFRSDASVEKATRLTRKQQRSGKADPLSRAYIPAYPED